MNPALRTLPATALLAGAALLAAPQAAARADDDGGGLAGTHAGEGRAHPGRTPAPTPSRDTARPSSTPGGRDQADPRFQLVPDWTPSSLRLPHERERRGAREVPQDDRPYATERTAAAPGGGASRVLPLGTGLALTGLGLGLAFLGLRLRRG
ncbi:hypothetical protein ACH4TX_11145 [Streptomyces sp. NPDC021098]|uniref:hypothetical protein n=1 Tax=unclassified Streptomyces TaxID=2593676 RepID=UPI00379D101F